MKTSVSVPGYRIAEEIYRGNRTLIYRGIRELDRHPVILKLLRNSFPSFDRLMQFRHQYEIGKDFDHPNIVKTLGLVPYQNSYALIFEDCGSISLQSYLAQFGAFGDAPQTLITFLHIAIQLAEALDELYLQRVIHKDIKPANILIDPETQQIKLIDFSLASLLPKEIQEIKNPNLLVGTLAYMAPEQTGRMNRGIDYRSDFYTLGVTFYELLTGQLPFISNDPMELVHSHLAKQPLAARQLNANIPLMISQVVCKLMSKNAEDRYQNALGLKHDLEICLAQLQDSGKIGLFVLGERDLSDRFAISEKLYGREPEVATLLNAFERVSKGIAEIVLVAGCSGIGKTVVIQEVHKPIVRQRGYFIKGKYDQFQRNIPFSAFVQAFRALMGQLLCESDLQLQIWKDEILTAVGENGQVLIDVIPELDRIIGKQLPAPELSGSAAQQRFVLLMQKFVRLFTTAAHPLVLFLDDLQWADLASLNLLQLLMEDAGYLLVLGAYRDNEVSPIHPSMLAIEEIEKTGVTVNTITLESLTQEDLNQLVAETLNCDLLVAQPLAELVNLKTKGNPFFTTQFLKALHEDGLISFDRLSQNRAVGGWSCDLAQIRALAVTDDVVEFMALQLQKLPPATQEAIALAACIGAQFDLHTLSIVLERSPEDTAAALWSGLQENLLIPTTEIYKFYQDLPDLPDYTDYMTSVNHASHTPNNYPLPSTLYPLPPNATYRFLHDRVQQAAYSLIPDRSKQATHLKIGRLLQQNYAEVIRAERLFDIVGHLNLAKELITDPIDRQRIVDLNFSAGKKARNSTAYTAANIYLHTGIELLNVNCWETQYQLTLDLHVAAAEVAYLEGNLEQMESIADVVLRSARTILDKVSIYRIQIAALTANGRMKESIDVGINALSELGIRIPTIPDQAETSKVLEALNFQLKGRQIEELIDLPVISDIQTQKTIELLAYLAAPIFITIPELMPILSSTMVSLSLQFGNTPASALGYVNHGLVMNAFLDNVEAGYCFGNLALNVLCRFDSQESRSTIFLVFGSWIQHRKEPLRSTMLTLKNGYIAGMENGNFFNASYSISCYFDASLLCGVELNTWESEISPYSKDLERVKQYSAQSYVQMKQQVAQNLISSQSQPECLIGTAYDETVMIPKHVQDGDLTALAYAYIYKLMLAYLFGNYTAALENITQADRYLQAVSGMIPIPVFHFYAALTHLALLAEESAQEQAETLIQVETHQATIDLWAQTAPMNYRHKWHLIEAEKQRLAGNRADAIDHYDLAIAGAKEHQFVHEEALATELAAKFYLAWGKEKIAQSYLTEAYYCYTRWGAKAKVEQLIALYPQLLASVVQSDLVDDSDRDVTDLSSSLMCESTFLDLDALLKASQAISQQVQLDRLIANLLEIVVANAGADKCVLLLQSENELQVVAKKVGLVQPTQLLEPIAFELSTDLAISLVNNVSHSLQPILLTDAIESVEFMEDSYLQQHQPYCVLCTPIVDGGELVGILYLENQLTTGSFTRDRIETLQILVAQAAISIENAKLYRALQTSVDLLEQKVEERTSELQTAKEAADRANEAKTIFFNNMSHELRTPLNAILGMSEALAEQAYGPLNQQQLRYIKIINSSGTHLLSLIDDILDLAKIEAGKLELYCEPINIRKLCDDSLEFVKPQALNKQIHLEMMLPTNLPHVMLDERRMRQVLINLLANAVKFTPEDGCVSLAVTHMLATSTEDKDWMQFVVSDTGIGIEPENLARLFQPFVQIDSALNRKAQGTGLGLNLVREIVKAHGGRVSVSSELGVGSRFTVDLPCGDRSLVMPLSPARSTSDLELSADRTQLKPPPLLIVDDDQSTIETLTDYLEAKGYNIIVATNGQEAIELNRLHHPNAILMDIKMPVLNGLEAIEQLRSDPEHAQLPIIALTALAMNGDRERCLAAGATEYLTKPVTLGLLAATIQELVTHA